MIKILVIILFWCIFALSMIISYYWFKLVVPHIKSFSPLDHYPFICEKCFTTWCGVSLYIMGGYLLNMPLFTILGIIISIGNGIGICLTEKERKNYENN